MRHLTAMTAALTLLALAPLTATAKGPEPAQDFVVNAELSASEWASNTKVGTFSTSGIIEDSGDVYLVDSFLESDQILWQVYEFVGTAGSLQSALRVRPLPDHRDSHEIEIVGIEGNYLGFYAMGTARGRTKKTCYWIRDPLFNGKVCTYTVDWTLNADLP